MIAPQRYTASPLTTEGTERDGNRCRGWETQLHVRNRVKGAKSFLSVPSHFAKLLISTWTRHSFSRKGRTFRLGELLTNLGSLSDGFTGVSGRTFLLPRLEVCTGQKLHYRALSRRLSFGDRNTRKGYHDVGPDHFKKSHFLNYPFWGFLILFLYLQNLPTDKVYRERLPTSLILVSSISLNITSHKWLLTLITQDLLLIRTYSLNCRDLESTGL